MADYNSPHEAGNIELLTTRTSAGSLGIVPCDIRLERGIGSGQISRGVSTAGGEIQALRLRDRYFTPHIAR